MMRQKVVFIVCIVLGVCLLLISVFRIFPLLQSIVLERYVSAPGKNTARAGKNVENFRSFIAKNPSITELAITMNDNINVIPPEIGTLSELTMLRIIGVPVESVPPEIGTLTNLTTLVIRHTSLADVPQEIGELRNLTHLELSHNVLSTFPETFWQLTNLESLSIGYNAVSQLPGDIRNFTKLIALDIRGNGLTTLPKGLTKLTSLRRVYAGENNFSEETKTQMQQSLPDTTFYW